MKNQPRLLLILLMLAMAIAQPSRALAETSEARLVLLVNFDQRDARDLSGEKNDGLVVGNPLFEEGYDGGWAVRFDNDFGRNATQYIDFGKQPSLEFGKSDFSIVFWYKTYFGGAPSWAVESSDPDLLTYLGHSKNGSGVILSDKDFATPYKKGFAISDTPNRSYISTSFVGRDTNWTVANGPVKQIDGIWQGMDERWHQIAVVFKRKATCSMYIDGSRVKSVDISQYQDDSIVNEASFVLGADGRQQYGLCNGVVDELRAYSGAIGEDEIAGLYSRESLKAFVCEIGARLDTVIPGRPYRPESIVGMRAVEAEAKAFLADSAADSDACAKERQVLEQAYYNFLLDENANLVMMLTSDTHVTTREDRNSLLLSDALMDHRKYGFRIDGVVITGDLSHIARSDYMGNFFDVIDQYEARYGDLQFAMITGNHDLRPKWGGNYKNSIDVYKTRNAKYSHDADGTPYFAMNIAGYDFIGINSDYSPNEHDIDLNAHLDDVQLAWMGKTLGAIASRGDSKGIFFLSHQPFSGTCYTGGAGDENCIGEQEVSIRKMLESCHSVVALNGHIHNGLGCASLDQIGAGFWQLNLPSLVGMNRGYASFGTVYIMYVYDDVIVFRARDTIKGIWLPAYDFTLYR